MLTPLRHNHFLSSVDSVMATNNFTPFFDSFTESDHGIYKEYKTQYFEKEYQMAYIQREPLVHGQSFFAVRLNNADNTKLDGFNVMQELVSSLMEGQIFQKAKHFPEGLAIRPACMMFLDHDTMAHLASELKEWIEKHDDEKNAEGWVMTMYLDGIALKFFKYASKDIHRVEALVKIFIHFPSDCIQSVESSRGRLAKKEMMCEAYECDDYWQHHKDQPI